MAEDDLRGWVIEAPVETAPTTGPYHPPDSSSQISVSAIDYKKKTSHDLTADQKHTIVPSPDIPRREPPFSRASTISVGGAYDPKPTDHGDRRPTRIPGLPIIMVDASARTPGGSIGTISLSGYLGSQLAVGRLNDIHKHLWWAGRPGNVRALHIQRMMKREILVTENIGLHLVWFGETIYIKPLPAYLLNLDFFTDHICPDPKMVLLANGFLSTYAKMVRHPVDFHIAKELGLLPEGIEWEAWGKFSMELQNTLCKDDINKRYFFGELRLARLNHIYRFVKWEWSGYHMMYRQYGEFFSKNFGWMLLLVVYMSVILSAMQVVLATLKQTDFFNSLSYDFGVTAILLVVVSVGLQAVLWAVLWVYHLVCTICNLQKTKSEWVLSSMMHRRGQAPTAEGP